MPARRDLNTVTTTFPRTWPVCIKTPTVADAIEKTVDRAEVLLRLGKPRRPAVRRRAAAAREDERVVWPRSVDARPCGNGTSRGRYRDFVTPTTRTIARLIATAATRPRQPRSARATPPRGQDHARVHHGRSPPPCPQQLDSARLRERRGRVLTIAAAIGHDEARTTPIRAGEPSPTQGNPSHCCPVAGRVATPGRWATTRIALCDAEFGSAPERIRALTFGFVAGFRV